MEALATRTTALLTTWNKEGTLDLVECELAFASTTSSCAQHIHSSCGSHMSAAVDLCGARTQVSDFFKASTIKNITQFLQAFIFTLVCELDYG